MMGAKIFTLLLIISVCDVKSVWLSSTLSGVMILSRHGDRNPTTGYPNDPYKHHEWPGGHGALSPLGLQNLCKSGLIKANRYKLLLREDNIYIRSSFAERCIQSAESFLDGFVPSAWRKSVHIDVIPSDEDEFLIIPGKSCPKYDDTLSTALIMNQTEVHDVLMGNEKVIDYIRECTGFEPLTLIEILNVEDAINVQMTHGFEMPTWARPIFHTYLEPLGHIAFIKMSISRLMQIKSGVFLNDIIERLERGIAERKKNILYYSGHDLNISSLLMYLGIVNQGEGRPGFGSAFVIELYKSWIPWHDSELRFLYFRTATDEYPIEFNVPLCPAPCKFERFKSLMKPILVDNYTKICSK